MPDPWNRMRYTPYLIRFTSVDDYAKPPLNAIKLNSNKGTNSVRGLSRRP